MIRQGDVLNDTYVIQERIGAGGGGIIYKAYHRRLNVEVVVKQIKDEVKGRIEGRAEADVLKRLRQTYLPRVYDFLEIDGEVYTVMDYIPGMDMKRALEQNGGRFEQKQVLTWARELAEALAYLHGMEPQIIHSDIKPANIMLQPDGHICLIDFNVSLAFDSSMRTSTGVSAGFSPPEQYPSRESYRKQNHIGAPPDGSDVTLTMPDIPDTTETLPLTASDRENRRTDPAAKTSYGDSDSVTAAILDKTLGSGIDARSDIYSLGATLYMLLTGIKPTSSYWEIVPIDEVLREGISQGFATIIKKMMAIDPADRYADGAALKNALDHIEELDDVYRRYRARRRARKGSIAALFILSAALMAGGFLVMQKERDAAYNDRIVEANELISNQSYSEADEAIAAAKQLAADRIDAYLLEMKCLYATRDYDACIRYGAENVNNPLYRLENQSDFEALGNMLYLLANAYYETGDYKNAVATFSWAIDVYSDNGAYYRDMAITLAKTGNVREAESALNEAKSKGLGEDSIYMTEGEIAYAKADYLNAVDLFRRVLATTEDEEIRRRTVFLCADSYRQLGGDYGTEYIGFLEDYQTLNGRNDTALTELLAEAYAGNGEPERAIDKFQEIIDHGFATYRIYENLAVLQQESGDLEGARSTLFTADNIYPDRYETYKRLAILEADAQSRKENAQRDYRQMKAYYDKAVSLCEADDPEMQRLEKMMEDVKAGGWL